MKRALAVASLALASALGCTLASVALADDGPPAGWEASPPRDAAPLKAIDRCGSDATCLHRQLGLDAPVEDKPWTIETADFASLPVVRVLSAPKDEAALRAVPPVRVIDGKGRPFPWPDGAQREVRVMPPGTFGEIAWGDEWGTPFFQDPAYRSMGYGESHGVVGDPNVATKSVEGKLRYHAIDADGAGPGLVYDHVVGKLDGTPSVVATKWEHAQAAPLPGGIGHAFRKDGDAAVLHVLLPEVLLGADSRNTVTTGGFFPGSRFSTDEAFTLYELPAAVGTSATTTFEILDNQRRRWPRSAQSKIKAPRRAAVVISTSRTSVEGAPTVVVVSREVQSAF